MQSPEFEQGKTSGYTGSLEKAPYLTAETKIVTSVFNPLVLHHDKMFQQAGTDWAEPILLFEEDGTGEVIGPSIVSDTYGNIHVFWIVTNDSDQEPDLIYYMRQDAIGWTTPVDILAGDFIRGARAAVGQDGYIYLIWSNGNGILYSRAPIQGAEFVKYWSEPVPLTNSNAYADLFTSASGRIYLAYPGTGTSGVFEQVLEPNGSYWSSTSLVSQTSLTNTASEYVRVKVSDNGTVHVVWTEFYFPESWPPRGVFYARSVDGGNTWSAPEALAIGDYDQINITVVDDNNIHVVWNGAVMIGGRYHRWSSDGGKTWSDTMEVTPVGMGGTSGLPQIVTDQAGTVHLLTDLGDSCLWYTYLENQIWAPRICISGKRAFLEEPAMGISEGNKLHAVFWDNRKSLWYTTKTTDAPWIAPKKMDEAILQPNQEPVPMPTPVVTLAATSTSIPLEQQFDPSPRLISSVEQILTFSLAPVVLLTVLIVVFGFVRKRK